MLPGDDDFKEIDFDYITYVNEDNENLPMLRKIINDLGQE